MERAEKQRMYSEARKIIQDREKVCVNCGSREDIEMHHIVPLSRGGSNNEGNIVYLCHGCHNKAHDCLSGHSGGRHRKEPVKGWRKIIDSYLKGEYTHKETLKRLGCTQGVKIKELWYYKEYTESEGIESIRYYGKTRRRREIAYKDGRIEEYCNGVKVLPGGETEE